MSYYKIKLIKYQLYDGGQMILPGEENTLKGRPRYFIG